MAARFFYVVVPGGRISNWVALYFKELYEKLSSTLTVKCRNVSVVNMVPIVSGAILIYETHLDGNPFDL